jgi:hypothetical protein
MNTSIEQTTPILNTRLLKMTQNGLVPQSYFIEEKKYSSSSLKVNICIKGNSIGEMVYEIDTPIVFIKRMYNHTISQQYPIQGIGTALLEWLVRKYPDHCIMLESTNSKDGTPSKFYSLGFRKTSQFILYGEELNKILKVIPINTPSYLISQKQASEIVLKIEKIMGWKNYNEVVKEIAIVLNKYPDQISNHEVVDYFLYSQRNIVYEKTLKEGCSINYLLEGIMYIPSSNFKKLENKFSRFIQLASNLSFSKKEALESLSNLELIQLVEKGIINPSNAMDIEAKLVSRENDPKRWELILSDIGLEMMRLNCFSAFLFCTYLNEESLSYLISESGLSILKQALVTWDEVINLPPSLFPYIFSQQGEEDLKSGNLKFSSGKFGSFSLERCSTDKLPINSFWRKVQEEKNSSCYVNSEKNLNFNSV